MLLTCFKILFMCLLCFIVTLLLIESVEIIFQIGVFMGKLLEKAKQANVSNEPNICDGKAMHCDDRSR